MPAIGQCASSRRSIRHDLARLAVLACIFALAASGASARRQRSKPEQKPAEDSVELTSDLVLVPAFVEDKRGLSVDDLSERDFALSEDGARRDIAFFQHDLAPVDVLLLVDSSGSTGATFAVLQSAVNEFLGRLKNTDSFALMTFSEKPDVLLFWSHDRAAARSLLLRVTPGGATALYYSLDSAMKLAFADRPATNRRAVVVLTDGLDTASAFDTVKSADATALSLDATLYVVSVDRMADRAVDEMIKQGRVAPDLVAKYREMQVALREAEAPMTELAESTGGRILFPKDSGALPESYRRIADEIRSRYVLGFYADTSAAQGFHSVGVRVSRPDVTVHARSGYYQGGR